MKTIGSVLSFLFFLTLSAETQVDPFAAPLADNEQPELTVSIYTLNSNHTLHPATPRDYQPMDEYDEEMDAMEMGLLRFFHKAGIDFIGVEGSLVCLTDEARRSIVVTRPYRYFIIVKQTSENQRAIADFLREKFDSELMVESVKQVSNSN